MRANFSADGPKRLSKWYPIFKSQPEVARQQLTLDRKQALITVRQMKLDFDSYNTNSEFGALLEPLDLDFNKDIEEMSLPKSTSQDDD